LTSLIPSLWPVGEGTPTTVQGMTRCDIPSAVSSVTYTEKTDNSLTVSWGAPSRINGDANRLDYDVSAYYCTCIYIYYCLWVLSLPITCVWKVQWGLKFGLLIVQ